MPLAPKQLVPSLQLHEIFIGSAAARAGGSRPRPGCGSLAAPALVSGGVPQAVRSPRVLSFRVRLSLCRGLALLAVLPLFACDRSNLTDGKSYPVVTKPPDPPPVEEVDKPITISEVMVENTNTIEDPPGKFSPWIELYNNSDEEQNLAGVTLSDDLSVPEKWAIPDIPAAKVPPRGFLVVFIDGDATNQSDLHANFTIAKGQLSLVANRDKFFRFNAANLPAD